MLGASLIALGLGATLACVPEECSVDFTLGGDLNGAWSWRHPTASCNVAKTEGLFFAGIEFQNDNGEWMRFELPDDTLGPGIHAVEVLYATESFEIWRSQSDCILDILEFEIVDWNTNDRYRMRGTVVCTEPLVNMGNGSQITLDGIVWSVYTPDANEV